LLDAAENAARAADDSDLLGKACVKRAAIQLELADSHAALAALQAARAALGDAARRHVALHVVEAHTEILRTHLASARKTAEHALALAQDSGDVEGELHARAACVAAAAALGDPQRAQRHLDAVLDLVQRALAPRAVTRARLALGEAYAFAGDVARARRCLLDVLASAHADHDFAARDLAALWLRLLGIPVPRVPRDQATPPHPVVRAVQCLAEAAEARAGGDEARARSRLDVALELKRVVDLPLQVRVLVLRAVGMGARADQLLAEVAQRLPVMTRRKFLSMTAQAARLVPAAT
jgi:tetratricopeptide (TPR) repeat protein